MAEVEKWGQDPEMNARLLAISQVEADAERTKNQAAEALKLASLEAAKIVYELMTQSDDEQVRLRAAEIIFSRTIAKIAAKHIEESGDTIDSADTANLRESIAAEILKIKRGEQNGN